MAINVLSPRIYNRIAAGEVVEKPASIVKELVENSLDAHATQIKVEIEEGGIKKIVVSDNGTGIAKEDLPLAFLPHATSKIASIDDLDGIATLGFRGEALASIASVCMVSLSTKTHESETGYKIEADGGEISDVKEVARLDGTTITTQNLFYNTPARAKFLRKTKTEESDITHLVEKFMLSHPEVSFEYIVDGKVIYNHASGELNEVIYLIYGREVYEKLLQLDYEEDGVRVGGYIVSPKLTRPNRTYQTLFVNGRCVENYLISACVQGAYEPVLMKSRFPIYVIKLEIPYDRVDVNVHPNKKEVKFDNSSKIFGIVRRAVEKALSGVNLIAEFDFSNKEEEEWSKFSIQNDKDPQRTGFDSYQKTSVDVMSANEGASFKVKIDTDSVDEKVVSPSEYKKQGIEIINMPEFSSVKSDETRRNRPGGNIFFDQSGDSLLHEVELSVNNGIENGKKLVPDQQIREEKFLTSKAEEIKIIGVVFKTYIITEFEDSIYVIDQHAMHERQNYEKLKKQIEQNNISKQDLLVPYEVKLLAKDRDLFASKVKNLQEIGFDIKDNGKNFEITAVPYVMSSINLEKFVGEILSSDYYSKTTASALVNDKLCQSACKHAIRAGDSVSNEEIVYLIEKMKTEIVLCPHGRPIIVKITRKDLEKMFKRVL
ncbi:MAG: DNA mismatch repair endonuclease MutL [Clostridia bacterium]|nr:DNA mismatch repair endonuclease MutL [Clostridia bacterium]